MYLHLVSEKNSKAYMTDIDGRFKIGTAVKVYQSYVVEEKGKWFSSSSPTIACHRGETVILERVKRTQ